MTRVCCFLCLTVMCLAVCHCDVSHRASLCCVVESGGEGGNARSSIDRGSWRQGRCLPDTTSKRRVRPVSTLLFNCWCIYGAVQEQYKTVLPFLLICRVSAFDQTPIA